MAALKIFEKHHVVARLQRRKQVLRQQAAVLRVRVKREIHAGDFPVFERAALRERRRGDGQRAVPPRALAARDHDDRGGPALRRTGDAGALEGREQAVQERVLPDDRIARRLARFAEQHGGILRRLLRRALGCRLRRRRRRRLFFHFFRRLRRGCAVVFEQASHFGHAALRLVVDALQIADLPVEPAVHPPVRLFYSFQEFLGLLRRAAAGAAAGIQLSAGKQGIQNAVNVVFHAFIPRSPGRPRRPARCPSPCIRPPARPCRRSCRRRRSPGCRGRSCRAATTAPRRARCLRPSPR